MISSFEVESSLWTAAPRSWIAVLWPSGVLCASHLLVGRPRFGADPQHSCSSSARRALWRETRRPTGHRRGHGRHIGEQDHHQPVQRPARPGVDGDFNDCSAVVATLRRGAPRRRWRGFLEGAGQIVAQPFTSHGESSSWLSRRPVQVLAGPAADVRMSPWSLTSTAGGRNAAGSTDPQDWRLTTSGVRRPLTRRTGPRQRPRKSTARAQPDPRAEERDLPRGTKSRKRRDGSALPRTGGRRTKAVVEQGTASLHSAQDRSADCDRSEVQLGEGGSR